MTRLFLFFFLLFLLPSYSIAQQGTSVVYSDNADSLKYCINKEVAIQLLKEGFEELEVDLAISDYLFSEGLYSEASNTLRDAIALLFEDEESEVDADELHETDSISKKKAIDFIISITGDYYNYGDDVYSYESDTIEYASPFDFNGTFEASFTPDNFNYIEKIATQFKIGNQSANEQISIDLTSKNKVFRLGFSEEYTKNIDQSLSYKDSSDITNLGFSSSIEKDLLLASFSLMPQIVLEIENNSFKFSREGYVSNREGSLSPSIGLSRGNMWLSFSFDLNRVHYSTSWDTLNTKSLSSALSANYYGKFLEIGLSRILEAESMPNINIYPDTYGQLEVSLSITPISFIEITTTGGQEKESYGEADTFFLYNNTLYNYDFEESDSLGVITTATSSYFKSNYKYSSKEIRYYIAPSLKYNYSDKLSISLNYSVEAGGQYPISEIDNIPLDQKIFPTQDPYISNTKGVEISYFSTRLISSLSLAIESNGYYVDDMQHIEPENNAYLLSGDFYLSFLKNYLISFNFDLEKRYYKELLAEASYYEELSEAYDVLNQTYSIELSKTF